MDWDDVKKLLLSQVIALMGTPSQGEEWLASLEKCADGERLGICMAIDVLSEAIDPQKFADIIERIDPKDPDVREAFGKAINQPPNCYSHICSSNFYPGGPETGLVYVRIMELGDFITFCVDRGYTRSRSHVKRIRTMYFDRGGVKLGGVRKWFRGRLPNVWVTSFDELHRLIDGVRADQRGTVVYDAFGLTIKNGVGGRNKPELIGVKYPENFSVGCSQPTTLDAWWVDAGGYYLSYGKDDAWGRTQSLTGGRPVQRERVHSHFKNLTPGYETYYIGIASRPVGMPKELLRQGYLRLEIILRSKSSTGSPTP